MRFLLSVFLLSVFGGVAVGQADDSGDADTVGAIAAQLSGADVVRGEFVQKRFLHILSRPLISRGEFFYQRNLGARWQVTAPFPSVMYITPQGVSYRQQQSQPMAEQFGQLLLALLTMDTERLGNHFQMAAKPAAVNSDNWLLTLTPRSSRWRQVIDEIQVRGEKAISTIEIFESSGDRVLVEIGNIRYQPLLNDRELGELNRAVETLTQ